MPLCVEPHGARIWTTVTCTLLAVPTSPGRQSSQLAEPLWNDPGLKSGISVRELISTLKKKKKKNAVGDSMVELKNEIK